MVCVIGIIVVAVAFIAFIVLPRLLRLLKKSTPEKVEDPIVIKFYDGPLNGTTKVVETSSPWFLYPFLPEDRQDEWEDDETRTPVEGMRFVKPFWAYYQQIDGTNYFFVREISEDEMLGIYRDGKLPKPVKKD